jgi:putative SOS response-associated peptidase YedK
MCGEMEIASAMFGFVHHWANHNMVRQIYSARTEIVVRDLSFRSAWKR